MTTHHPKYRPSSGTEGDIFFANWCFKCEAKELCPIPGATMAFDINDAEYPIEWIRKEGAPTCTAFIKTGETMPFKDDLTIDMFEVLK